MEHLPLSIYDIAMLAVLVLATVFGAWKGMAWQIASLTSIVLSATVAVHFSDRVAPYLSQAAPWNRFLAMLILYLLTSLAVWLLFRLVAGAIDRVRLKDFDRQLGAIIGLAKGVVFCVLITFFVVTLSESLRQTVLQSHSGYYIAVFLQKAEPLLPEEVRHALGKYIDDFQQRLDPNQPAKPVVAGTLKIDGNPLGGTLLEGKFADGQVTDGKLFDGKTLDNARQELGDWLKGEIDKIPSPSSAIPAPSAAPSTPNTTNTGWPR